MPLFEARTHREGRAPPAMIREVGDEGFETDEEGEDTVGAFEHGTGILGASNLLRVASSVGLQGRSEQLLTDVDDDSAAAASPASPSSVSAPLEFAAGKPPSPGAAFADDPGAAATMAVARLIANTGSNRLPASLVRLMSPYQAHYEEVRVLGRGGFGSVVSALGRLDNRAVAVKKIHFRSAVPPWAKNDALEALHDELLREARALALMDDPRVVKYHSAWIEPRWAKLAKIGGGGGVDVRTGAVKSLASPTSMPAHDEDASDSFESDSSASESDESDAASGARLLPATRNVGPKSPGEGRTRSGVSSVWTPAAVAASTRWPYTLHIAMELCPGSTLRDWIRQRPRGDVRMGAVAHIFRRLVEALRYVHAHGVIHRDVKPANVLVHRGVNDLEPTVKLMDFGLAVFSSPRDESRRGRRETRAGATDDASARDAPTFSVGVGTASYCAPEQRRGLGRYTSAVDMYSAGVVLVEMLAPLGADATESERLHIIAEAKSLNLPEETTNRFPKHAALAKELLAFDPKARPTAAATLRRWPRVNLRESRLGAPSRAETVVSDIGFTGGRNGDRMLGGSNALVRAAVAAAAGAAAAASFEGEGGGGREVAAVTAALGSFAPLRSQSLPEAELAAVAEAVALAKKETADAGKYSGGTMRLGLGPSVPIDIDTASRGDLADEVRRLREKLSVLEASGGG